MHELVHLLRAPFERTYPREHVTSFPAGFPSARRLPLYARLLEKKAGALPTLLRTRRIAVPSREIEASEVYKEGRIVRSELDERSKRCMR